MKSCVMRYWTTILGATLIVTLGWLGGSQAQVAGPATGGPAASGPATGGPATGYADDLHIERCYVTFFRYWGGRGHALTRFGPEQIRNVVNLRYRPGRPLNGRILSVATGPDTWIELFDHSRFRRSLYRIGPDQAVNLKSKIVDSYRIHCRPPEGW